MYFQYILEPYFLYIFSQKLFMPKSLTCEEHRLEHTIESGVSKQWMIKLYTKP